MLNNEVLKEIYENERMYTKVNRKFTLNEELLMFF